MYFMKLISSLFLLLFHSSPFHLFSLFVILFALANGRFCQGNLNYCRSFKTTGNGIIKSIHVVREKTLADGSQTRMEHKWPE